MSKVFQVDVVSAKESIFSGPATFVALPGESGELGILPGHIPLISRIRPGTVRIQTVERIPKNWSLLQAVFLRYSLEA